MFFFCLGLCKSFTLPIHVAGTNLLQTFFRALSLGGTQALVVQLLLAYTLKQMLPQGQIIQPGAEFVSARQVCRQHH